MFSCKKYKKNCSVEHKFFVFNFDICKKTFNLVLNFKLIKFIKLQSVSIFWFQTICWKIGWLVGVQQKEKYGRPVKRQNFAILHKI